MVLYMSLTEVAAMPFASTCAVAHECRLDPDTRASLTKVPTTTQSTRNKAHKDKTHKDWLTRASHNNEQHSQRTPTSLRVWVEVCFVSKLRLLHDALSLRSLCTEGAY